MLGGFFLLSLQGCSTLPLQSHGLLKTRPIQYQIPTELDQTPFFPQTEYQCGPAALATVMNYHKVFVSPEELREMIYIPGRKGSLQIELIAATRTKGLVPYVIDRQVEALLDEVRAGNPVLVLQNLGLDWYPQWHYAVVIGYDLSKNEIILRSGINKRHINSFELFERTWRRSKYWGMVVLPPDELPRTARPFSYLKTVSAFQELNKPEVALQAYQTALKRWPKDRKILMAFGNALYAQKDYKSAEKTFHRILKSNKEYAPALNNLALVVLKSGRYRQAEKYAIKALQIGGRYTEQYKETLQSIRAARAGARNK